MGSIINVLVIRTRKLHPQHPCTRQVGQLQISDLNLQSQLNLLNPHHQHLPFPQHFARHHHRRSPPTSAASPFGNGAPSGPVSRMKAAGPVESWTMSSGGAPPERQRVAQPRWTAPFPGA